MCPRSRTLIWAVAWLVTAVATVDGQPAAPASQPAVADRSVLAPRARLGFEPGADRRLADWNQITSYLDELARASDRVRILELGTTTQGRRLVGALVSSAENLARVDRHRQIIRRLADPRGLGEAEAARLAAEGRVLVVIGASIHASEVGASQMAPELVHHLITDDSPRTRRIRDDVLLLLLPSLNPDGLDLVADWYRRTLGTEWEGARMPWLYNEYVGHDINRDFFMLNQLENRHLARVLYEDWHPQVFLSMHQMGTNGPRMFVPPNYEPVDPNYEPLIWRQAGLLGHAMATELEAHGHAGVITNAMYDYYFPGYEDSGPLGHNTVCLLTEVASVRVATPVTIAPEELRGTPKGLPDYRVQQNFPHPWPGGEWRLRDILDYDRRAALGLLDAASKYRSELLMNFYRMGRNQVARGRHEPPFAFVVPVEQRDPLTAAKMIDILRAGRVEVARAEAPFEADGRRFEAGTWIIPMAQPFRAYAKTLLEPQRYPARRLSPGGPVERPYDVAGWTLPMQMGVETVRVDAPFEVASTAVDRAEVAVPPAPGSSAAAVAVSSALNDAYLVVNRILAAGGDVQRATRPFVTDTGVSMPAGSFVLPLVEAETETERGAETEARDDGDRERRDDIPARLAELRLPSSPMQRMPDAGLVEVRTPRVGLYRPWTASMDEGWTRWLLEQYAFPFVSVTDADIRAGRLGDRLDVLVLPSIRNASTSIVEGNRPGTTAPEYVGGIGEQGTQQVRDFVERGGTLITIGSSAAFAIDALDLPVRDAVSGLAPEEFFCPGSILRTRVDAEHPIGFGMPADSIAVFQSSPAFEILEGADRPRPRVVARYPDEPLLLSGWLEGGDRLSGLAAALDVPSGRGRVVLLGFGVQQRAQPHATFKMLFNALHLTGTLTAVPARSDTSEAPAPSIGSGGESADAR